MDFTRYLPELLIAAGLGLQWLRAYKGVHDGIALALAPALLAAGAYALTANYALPWRQVVIDGLVTMPGNVATIVGGTMGAARLAAGGLAAIPKTNSK